MRPEDPGSHHPTTADVHRAGTPARPERGRAASPERVRSYPRCRRGGRRRRLVRLEEPDMEEVVELLPRDLFGERDERVGRARPERVILHPSMQDVEERLVADLVPEGLQ